MGLSLIGSISRLCDHDLNADVRHHTVLCENDRFRTVANGMYENRQNGFCTGAIQGALFRPAFSYRLSNEKRPDGGES
jgi:hypothetical protein